MKINNKQTKIDDTIRKQEFFVKKFFIFRILFSIFCLVAFFLLTTISKISIEVKRKSLTFFVRLPQKELFVAR